MTYLAVYSEQGFREANDFRISKEFEFMDDAEEWLDIHALGAEGWHVQKVNFWDERDRSVDMQFQGLRGDPKDHQWPIFGLIIDMEEPNE